MEKKKRVELIRRATVCTGFFKIDQIELCHSLYAGGMSPPIRRELICRPDAVAVLPYDAIQDRVVLIEQFRIGAYAQSMQAWVMEIIAGMVEPGEQPQAVAHREALEEAGCTLQELIPIHEYLSAPGATSERVSIYCARVNADAVGGIHGLAHEGEDILVKVISYQDAVSYLQQGIINSAIPIIALQWLQLHREELRQRWCA